MDECRNAEEEVIDKVQEREKTSSSLFQNVSSSHVARKNLRRRQRYLEVESIDSFEKQFFGNFDSFVIRQRTIRQVVVSGKRQSAGLFADHGKIPWPCI